MKYTPRHIKKFLEDGKIDPDSWRRHFPHLLPSHVPECSECEDLKNNLCEGGKNPVDCFLAIEEQEETAGQDNTDKKSHKEKRSKGFFPDGKGKKTKAPAGANITFDQSKM